MSRTRKEQKAARRERQEQLRQASLRVQARLLRARQAGGDDAVEYVLPPPPSAPRDDDGTATRDDTDKTPAAAAPANNNNNNNNNNNKDSNKDDDDDRVHLPAVQRDKTRGRGSMAAASSSSRKQHKMTWQSLKVAVTSRYGVAAADVVEEHDCNAPDPLFLVYLKLQRRVVPVPRHWSQLRAFLSTQADREAPIGVVPPEIEALGVAKVRATKDKKANLNQVAFMTCFLTGTPLQLRRFAAPLTRFGETFHEGKWMPKATYSVDDVACGSRVASAAAAGGGGVCPGVLSTRLRQALGMTAHAPPPWLYSLQAMRRLPPAYPQMRIPGLNAPIPAGAQWGFGQGQWGEPPRADNNAFLFPGVMDEAASMVDGGGGGVVVVGGDGVSTTMTAAWGTVPPPAAASAASATAASPTARGSSAITTTTTAAGGATAMSRTPAVPAAAATTTVKPVMVTPVPFAPQSYVHQPSLAAAAAARSAMAPQEYVRVQDSTHDATVAVSHVLVPKNAVVPDNNNSTTTRR